MRKDVKYSYKTSYRINNYIKSIIDSASRDIYRETGLKISLGKLSRAFWVSLASNPVLRRKFINSVCKITIKEAANKNNKYYSGSRKKNGNRQGNSRKRLFLHQK